MIEGMISSSLINTLIFPIALRALKGGDGGSGGGGGGCGCGCSRSNNDAIIYVRVELTNKPRNGFYVQGNYQSCQAVGLTPPFMTKGVEHFVAYSSFTTTNTIARLRDAEREFHLALRVFKISTLRDWGVGLCLCCWYLHYSHHTSTIIVLVGGVLLASSVERKTFSYPYTQKCESWCCSCGRTTTLHGIPHEPMME
ncbi:hypothetical protein M0802_013994 [Mischocyttarus mexicanus]|nr:hypothetical protein M0802_013996 [Mischocyttarus mexicanus]KAI4481266.1 hypothetical protein M0802_013994 [Mischocyttarus mexicanus]